MTHHFVVQGGPVPNHGRSRCVDSGTGVRHEGRDSHTRRVSPERPPAWSPGGGLVPGPAGAGKVSAAAACDRVFAATGPLSELLPGYAPRDAQRAMAAAVERAVSDRSTLICEAGTGTGKTLAYLVPAVAGGGRIVVSTGTRHLQERLLERDLPLVCRALECTPRIALLKGRSNYLCRWRYDQVLTTGRLVSRQVARAGGASLRMGRPDRERRSRGGDGPCRERPRIGILKRQYTLVEKYRMGWPAWFER